MNELGVKAVPPTSPSCPHPRLSPRTGGPSGADQALDSTRPLTGRRKGSLAFLPSRTEHPRIQLGRLSLPSAHVPSLSALSILSLTFSCTSTAPTSACTSEGHDTCGREEQTKDREAGAPRWCRPAASPGACRPSTRPAGAWPRPVSAPPSRCRWHGHPPPQRPVERDCWQDGQVQAAPGAAEKSKGKG